MIYGTQVNTQKNMVAVRSIRQSFEKKILQEGISVTNDEDLSASKLPPLQTNSKDLAQQRMNRTSALTGFGDFNAVNTPVRAT